MPSNSPLSKPATATSNSTGLIGLMALLLAAWALWDIGLQPAYKTLIIMGACAFSMILWEILVLGTHKRSSTGLDWSRRDFNVKRCAIKILGFIVTTGMLACLYIIFPEYDHPRYQPAWDVFFLLLPYLIPTAILYIILVDSVMASPEDGYYNVGLIALGQYRRADKSLLLPHTRSWLIKGFFTPLMFALLSGNIGNLPENVQVFQGAVQNADILTMAILASFTLLTIDLLFTTCGYLFALRVIDTHERSSEPTFLGWTVALICYEPFWSVFDRYYLNKGPAPDWKEIVADYPLFTTIWSVIFIASLVVYTWATMAFGLRFSNLTHRGIITSGPYRFTKHPAYIAKNLSWWMTFAPFLMIMDRPLAAIQTCIVLLMINFIYYVRAKTEERHLSQDQTYRDYAVWIDRHGLFRWLNFKRS